MLFRSERVAAQRDLSLHREFVESLALENPERLVEIASALAALAEGDRPLLASGPETSSNRAERLTAPSKPKQGEHSKPRHDSRGDDFPAVRYRLEVGSEHGVKPKNIVGAIANEAGLESRFIGAIEIGERHSLVDLPDGMPKEIFHHLRKVRVCGKLLLISQEGQGADDHRQARPAPERRAKTQRNKPKKRQRANARPVNRAA